MQNILNFSNVFFDIVAIGFYVLAEVFDNNEEEGLGYYQIVIERPTLAHTLARTVEHEKIFI